jgi:hypothetical protein
VDDGAHVGPGGEHRGVQPPLAGRRAALAGANGTGGVERHDVVHLEDGRRQPGRGHEEAALVRRPDVARRALVETERPSRRAASTARPGLSAAVDRQRAMANGGG